MNITIRHARLQDAHAIAEAERQIAQKPGLFCSQPFELVDENVTHTILSFLKNKNGVYLVAEQEGCLVGHAFLEPHSLQALSHVADLNIAVHLGWQGKGIGKKLLEQIIDWAKHSSSLEKIQLHVRASNVAAISLYKKMGFQEEGRLKNRLKIKDRYMDDLVMGLDLRNLSTQKNTLIQKPQAPLSINIRPAIKSELEILDTAITDFNIISAPELPRAILHRLDFSATHQNGELLGGIQARRFNWGILQIELLFVFEQYRNQGVATTLLDYVEQIARENQCHLAHLDTFDFQAKNFYLKHGYSVFGTLENAPKEHCHYYMKKELS